MKENAVTEALFELLHSHDKVTLPGVGSFVVAHQGAVADHVQQTIAPPQSHVRFDHLAVGDDGILVDYLIKKNQLSAPKANQLVLSFTKDVQTALQNKETVDIAQIGRLYLDTEGNYNFAPKMTNFNRDSFGLPDLNFQPIVRNSTRNTTEKAATESVTQPTHMSEPQSQTPDSKKSFDWEDFFQRSLPFIALLAFLLIVLTIWLVSKNLKRPKNLDVPKIEKPLYEEPTAVEEEFDMNEEIDSPVETESDNVEAASTEEVTEEIETPTPSLPTTVIIIGAFGEDRNAEKAMDRVAKAGFQPYRDYKNGVNRVGIQVSYSDLDDLIEQHEEIKDLYTESAWIINRKELFGN